jgi:hypothetical protein
MSSIVPILSYLASSDITSDNGSTAKFQVFFDPDALNNNNVIMFEYKKVENDSSPLNLDNTYFGYISVENAIQTGIQNQYVIAVPIVSNTLTGISLETIAVRVYFGATEGTAVTVSSWSSDLPLYVSPVPPFLVENGAFYDPHDIASADDDLFILLNTGNNAYDYDKIKFIVCYFFTNADGVTTWGVSPISSASRR